jgi:hypothetical protein
MSVQANHKGYVSGAARCVYSGSGYLLLLIASHNQGTVQTVTLYDNNKAEGDVLLKLHPWTTFIEIDLDRDHRLQFDKGLTVDPGNCEVTVIVESSR